MKPTYGELLQKPEWQTFRKKVLNRDKSLCQLCHNSKFITSGKPVFYKNHDNNNKSIFISSKENFDCGNFSVYKPEGLFVPMDGLLLLESYPTINKLIAFRELTERDLLLKQRIPSIVEQSLRKQLGTNERIAEYLMWGIFKDKNPMKFNETNFAEVRKQIDLLYSKADNDLLSSEVADWEFVSGVHVHHKRYILGKLPWEYELEDLTTLCWNCHDETHRNSEISVYDNNGSLIEKRKACQRCNGAGILHQFHHVENGICFRCRGERFEPKNFS